MFFALNSCLFVCLFSPYCNLWASLLAQLVNNPPAMQETLFNSWVWKIAWTRDRLPISVFLGFPCGSDGKKKKKKKNPAAMQESEWVKVTQSCLTLCYSWTVACQALLSMEFSRKECWSGLSFPSPGDLPNPGIKSRLQRSRPGSMGLQRVRHEWATKHSTAHNLYPVSLS